MSRITPAQLPNTKSLKWTQHPPDVLGAFVAEMDFGLAPAVGQALHEAVDRGDTGYPSPDREHDTAVAATGYWQDTFGWRVQPDRVFPVPDVVEGIRRAIMHLTAPGSPVVLHTPVYYPFFSMVERAGRNLIEVPSIVGADGRYRLDMEGIRAGFASGAGSIVLCNPWNPTGRSLTPDELTDVLDVATEHGGRVVVDEIHHSLTFPGVTHTVAASLDPDTVITVTAASKAWNLPGLKCGQVVLTNESDAQTWADQFTPETVGVGTFGLIASEAAYTSGRTWLDEVLAILDSNRSLLTDLVMTLLPDVGYVEPEATYLAWLDFRPYGIDAPAPHFLKHAKVALTDGQLYGGDGPGHVRLNFATHPDILADIVERMAAGLTGTWTG